ncbi:MAG TPA: hypothetical protein VGA50_02510 [Kiloniellales bacterium]
MKIVVALWRGQVPLPRTAWLYGGVLLVAFLSPVVVLTALRSPFLHSPLMVPLCVFVLLYAAFIAVAIWRSANNYCGWVAWRALAKGSVVVVFMQTAVKLAGS